MSKIDRATTVGGVNGRRTIELDDQEVILIDIPDSALGREVTVCFATAGKRPFRRCNCEQIQGCKHELEARRHLFELMQAFAELDDQRKSDECQTTPAQISPKKSISRGKIIGQELVRQALLHRAKTG